MENADIEAGGNVEISDVAMHSTVRAGHTLAVEGKKGLINGGFMAAGEEIRANTIGNTMNVITRLTVGVNPMIQKKYQTVLKEYNEAKKRLEQVTKMVNTLGKIDISQMPEDKAERINALIRSQFPLAGTVERNERTLKELDAELQKMKKGKIRVKDTMYPGKYKFYSKKCSGRGKSLYTICRGRFYKDWCLLIRERGCLYGF